jgi:hypothetical protein
VSLGEGLDLAGEGGFVVLADAAESPFGVGHFADEAGFGDVSGGEVVGEFVEEVGVFGEIVTGEEDGLGAETVAEVVAGRDGFAGFGGGAGGEFGVGLVGDDLGGCGHGLVESFRLEGSRRCQGFCGFGGGMDGGNGFGIRGLGIFLGVVNEFRVGWVGGVTGWCRQYADLRWMDADGRGFLGVGRRRGRKSR